MGGKQAVDSTGQFELEIYSPQDLIVYLSCTISGCNCQHHGHEASWDLIWLDALEIIFRLRYQPRPSFRPPTIRSHMLHATHQILLSSCHVTHTSRCVATATQQVSESSMQKG
jgi:hypothetical protein